jgi:hypothetical protein
VTLLLCAFVGFVLAQYVKLLFHLKSGRNWWVKMGVALAGSAGAAALIFRHSGNLAQDIAVYGLAGAGLGMLVHKIYRAVSAKGDDLITDIISKRQRR